jgi:hypothetical protein
MGQMVIVGYRPKAGRETDLLALTREHVPILRRLGFVSDRPAVAMRAKDGTIVEVFEWKDGAIAVAHEHPEVQAMWGRYAEAWAGTPRRATTSRCANWPIRRRCSPRSNPWSFEAPLPN